MTYKFNKETHSAKIKAGMQVAKQAGKKLGRPKGGKIKGEDRYLELCYLNGIDPHDFKKRLDRALVKSGHKGLAETMGVSIGTVQRIINKYKKENE